MENISRRSFLAGFGAAVAVLATGGAEAAKLYGGNGPQWTVPLPAGDFTLSAYVKPDGDGWYRVVKTFSLKADTKVTFLLHRLFGIARGDIALQPGENTVSRTYMGDGAGAVLSSSAWVASFSEGNAHFIGPQLEGPPPTPYVGTSWRRSKHS